MGEQRTDLSGGVDPTYPIYRIDAKWTEAGDSETRPWWPTDPGEGRHWDATGLDHMLREDPGIEEVERWAREEWWPTYAVRRDEPADVRITVEFRRRDSWVTEWFSHKTFDVGQTDEEALASFERFVRRYEGMQDYYPGEVPEGYVCLMGAQDRWRWYGGTYEARTDAPCRCDNCEEQGVLRVNH